MRAPTQAELIARALDNEEGNIVSHRHYLQFEEEKRKRAQVVRAGTRGPLVRWISRREEIKVVEPLPTPPSSAPYAYLYAGTYPFSTSTSANTSRSQTPFSGAPSFYSPYVSSTSANPYAAPPSAGPSPYPGTTAALPTTHMPYSYSFAPVAPLPPPAPVVRTEKVCKNYVVHELGQYEGAPQPPWQDTMTAMFGDHVKWENLKVYVTKGRPFGKYRASHRVGLI